MLESGENYLETILLLEQKNGTVRSVDVAAELCVSKPSVSRAMGILRENGYLKESAGALLLTDKGREKARGVLERHEIIACFLTQCLGVNGETAARDACRFEHDVSNETFEKMKAYVCKDCR